jgi:hypothetical protein
MDEQLEPKNCCAKLNALVAAIEFPGYMFVFPHQKIACLGLSVFEQSDRVLALEKGF